MRILGAILAGGQARRFGSDKALARLGGASLIDHVALALRPQVDALVVVGRDHRGFVAVPDRPEPALGPLGGLLGAMHHARAIGADLVLSAPCDMPGLPSDLAALLDPAPAFAADHPIVGLWPAALAAALEDSLARGERRVRRFAERIGARAVALPPLANVNRPEDLAELTHRRG